MSKQSRRPTRRNRIGRAPAPLVPATSKAGFLNREERRWADSMGLVGEPESPIPCLCPNGHRWFAPGTFQAGRGTYFENSADRWCPECGEPEEFSSHLRRDETARLRRGAAERVELLDDEDDLGDITEVAVGCATPTMTLGNVILGLRKDDAGETLTQHRAMALQCCEGCRDDVMNAHIELFCDDYDIDEDTLYVVSEQWFVRPVEEHLGLMGELMRVVEALCKRDYETAGAIVNRLRLGE